MLKPPWRETPLTKEQADHLFMLMFEDDTEDAPWMAMGDLQFWSASSFAHSLRNHAREQQLGWYVASMLPITYTVPEEEHPKTVSPDTFVAFVPDHPRTSFNVAEEGAFPPFVLEVVSPSSVVRDQRGKRRAYDLLGAREYALFTPRVEAPSVLEGYRRESAGTFVAWQPDAQGRLWSEVLGLFLVARGPLLQAQTPDGRLLLTPEQALTELRHEQDARQRAEDEAERLRHELERYRGNT
jgi:Uma2 family endonuclease